MCGAQPQPQRGLYTKSANCGDSHWLIFGFHALVSPPSFAMPQGSSATQRGQLRNATGAASQRNGGSFAMPLSNSYRPSAEAPEIAHKSFRTDAASIVLERCKREGRASARLWQLVSPPLQPLALHYNLSPSITTSGPPLHPPPNAMLKPSCLRSSKLCVRAFKPYATECIEPLLCVCVLVRVRLCARGCACACSGACS